MAGDIESYETTSTLNCFANIAMSLACSSMSSKLNVASICVTTSMCRLVQLAGISFLN